MSIFNQVAGFVLATLLASAGQASTFELVTIPAGMAVLGDASGDDNEVTRSVQIATFKLMRKEVTNSQFARFVSARKYQTTVEKTQQGYVWSTSWQRIKGADWRHPQGPQSSIAGLENHPVVQVSAIDAEAFANFTVCACQARMNGNMPRVAKHRGDIHGVTVFRPPASSGRPMPVPSAVARPLTGTGFCALHRSGLTLMDARPLALTTWLAMFGNGPQAGFPARLKNRLFAVVAGATIPIACEPPTDMATSQTSASIWLAFDARLIRVVARYQATEFTEIFDSAAAAAAATA